MATLAVARVGGRAHGFCRDRPPLLNAVSQKFQEEWLGRGLQNDATQGQRTARAATGPKCYKFVDEDWPVDEAVAHVAAQLVEASFSNPGADHGK